MAIPPPPTGFTLDQSGGIPPPPHGFTLDKPKSFGSKALDYVKGGSYLPTAGAVIGGVAGSELGPGAMGTAALGGAGGEALRQLLQRAQGKESPTSSLDAAKQIGTQGALAGAGEGAGQVLGKLGAAAYKGFPKVGQAISGTPAKNLVKAQKRGLMETYLPSNARGVSREQAGSAQGAIEDRLMSNFYKPETIAKMKLRKSGMADQIVQKSLTDSIKGVPMDPRQALATVKSIDVIYRDTPLGSKVAPELAKLRTTADAIVAKAFPEYKAAKQTTESTILRSQLSKPFPVNKSRPDEYSGFVGKLAPLAELGALSAGGVPLALKGAAGMVGASPLSMGVMAGTMGSAKRAIPAKVRKTLQRAAIQKALQLMQGQSANSPTQ